MNRHMFRDRNDERDLRLDSFFNSLRSLITRNVDSRCIWFCAFLGLASTKINQPTGHSRLSSSIKECWKVRNARTALTDGKTGKPKCSPSTPGLTPPTILVPHSRDSLTFAVACLPVVEVNRRRHLNWDNRWLWIYLPVNPWNSTLVWAPILRLGRVSA